MSDSPTNLSRGVFSESVNRRLHAHFIAQAAPRWMSGTDAEHRTSLKQAAGPAMPWYEQASLQRRAELKKALEAGWISPVSYTHLTLPTICSV